MDIEAALYTYLSTYAGLVALISTRIYPGGITQEAANLAAVSYSLIDSIPVHLGGADAAIYRPRFQFSCWGTSYANARAVAAQVKLALQDYTGVIGGVGGVTIQRIFYEDSNDLYEPVADGVRRCGRALDFIIWHE